jgi:hypothetical protein
MMIGICGCRSLTINKEYPDKAPVWCADNDDPADPWFLDYYENAVDDERRFIICAVGGLVPPPDDWRPEGEIK